MVTKDESLILKFLSEAKDQELVFKELNEKCANYFEGCRIILKKLKEEGYVSFDGLVPSISGKIKLLPPEERETAKAKMQPAAPAPSKKAGMPSTAGGEKAFLFKILQDHDGTMIYKELNEIYSQKFEGLRLLLKRLKETGEVNFDGDLPSYNSKITLVSK